MKYVEVRALACSAGAVAVALVALAAPGITPAQQRDARTIPVVYTAPGTDTVVVRKNIVYKTSAGANLMLDVYEPAGTKDGASLPAVVFVNGVGAPDLKDWRVYQDWARLVAARGFIAINHQSTRSSTAQDVVDLLAYVKTNAASLKVDAKRLGIWSCSANVRVALPIALDPARDNVRCAVFYYGLMAGKPGRDDVPTLVARAGLDSPSLNANIDAFVAESVARNLPLVLINYPEGQHAFDIFDDTDRSRLYVAQTLDFLAFHLTHDLSQAERAAREASPATFSRLITEEGWPKARQYFDAQLQKNSSSVLFREQTLNSIGYALLQLKRPQDAVEAFKLNVERFPDSPNVYDSLADGYEAAGEKALAIDFAQRALDKLGSAQGMSEDQKAGLRTSAEDKLKRLRPR
jgi:dienelactone hydrolase